MPQDQQQPLTGYRVLDLSGPIGVYCGKLMADMGADVVKVEPPGGDPMRGIGPFVHDEPGPDRSLHWLHYNTNKRSITLDIAAPQGATLLRRLAQGTDILVESFPPGHMESLGLGYHRLKDSNDGLIHVSITPFGQTGPYRDYLASDLVGFAMGGYMYATGWPHTPPTRLWGPQAYQTTSNRAFIAALIAVYHRLNTGEGQHIDVSMQESVAATTEHVNMAYIYDGKSAVRCGFRHGGQFVATWRCKDGYVSITTHTQQAWDDLRTWMERDGMVGDLWEEKYNERFILRGDLSAHVEELVENWTRHHTRKEIEEFGQANHHPWGPAATPADIMENPQLWERGFLFQVEHPELESTLTYPGAPYVMRQSPWKFRATAPGVGQHNADVYRQELGLSEGELETLAAESVI